MQDIIIIGGGLSGLYASKLTGGFILEKEKTLGGRVSHDNWYGEQVSMGAGIFRTSDRILPSLLNDFEIPYSYKYNPIYSTMNRCDVVKTFQWLRTMWKKNQQHIPPSTTFKKVAESFLGRTSYETFLHSTIYNDYENESAESILNDPSHFSDYEEGKYGYTDLHQLIVGLSSIVPHQTETEVIHILKDKKSCEIHALYKGKKVIYQCKRIIMATTISTARLLFSHPLLKLINSSPTLRIYGAFRKQDIPLLQKVIKGHTFVSFPIHQIIPIYPERGIYMIAYCDEQYANELSTVSDTVEHRSILSRLLEESFKIPPHSFELESIHPGYWDEAVHYINPSVPITTRKKMLHTIQHLYPRVRFVGEIVSEDNGWMEAALESVEKIDWVMNVMD